MFLGKNIRYLRKQKGMSQEYIAQELGYKSYTTIQKWETGDSEPPIKKVKQLAELFNVDIDDLTNKNLENPLPKNIIKLDTVRYVPVIGRIACGTPILAQENVIDRVILPTSVNATFALQCDGDSMIDAGIDSGDYVFIRSQPEVENGEIAAVLIGEEATLKKVYRSGDHVTLIPMNQNYEPMTYTAKETQEIHILGKLVAALKNFE